MYLTQSNVIRGLSKQEYTMLREMCQYSNNLYNVAVYTIRQHYFDTHQFLRYEENYPICKENENYGLLQAGVAQQILKVADRSFRSFFGLLQKVRAGDYRSKDVRLPHYREKGGWFHLVLSTNAINIKNGFLTVPMSREYAKRHNGHRIRINLHFHFNQGNPEIKYFNCSNYKGNRGTCQSTHYIRVDFLEEVVLGEIRRLTKFASLYEDDFLKAVIGHSQQADEADRKLKEKELKALLARDEELDGLFERIYEDNVSGKISDERFSRMSRRYEDEQKELTEKIKQLRSEIEKQSSRTMTTDMFISLVRKYTRAKKLTPRMLNELVEKIEVFNAEKVNGVWEQRLRIHYNCVGIIEIPSALPLPTPDVSVNTRKGVVVNYAPCDVAI